MKEFQSLPVLYQEDLETYSQASDGPKGTFFWKDKNYFVEFAPIPNADHGLGREDFESDGDFGRWFRFQTARFAQYCEVEGTNEPAILITTHIPTNTLFVQTVPLLGTPYSVPAPIIQPPSEHEVVIKAHGHPKNGPNYYPYFGSADFAQMCDSASDVSVVFDKLGATVAWRMDDFYAKLMIVEARHAESLRSNDITTLGKTLFFDVVKEKRAQIEVAKQENPFERRFLNEFFARILGFRLVRYIIDRDTMEWSSVMILHEPEPVPEELRLRIPKFKQRTAVTTQILGII